MSTVLEQEVQTLDVCKEIEIAAPLEIAFQALLDEMGPESQMGDGSPMPMILEAFPGGRWYRDLGNNAGHFWGHVQVIKPPTLLEIVGPMFMSYPAASHLQYRLKSQAQGTLLVLTHKAFGFIPAEHREGVNKGWQHKLGRVRELAEKRRK